MSSSTATTHARTSTRTGRRWIVAILLIALPVGLVAFGYLSTRFVGGMRLDEAMAEADKLDPGWRFADLEASRAPYPEPAKNGIDQALRVKAAMPKGKWPEWPFPQFNSDKPYLGEVRLAMDDSLVENRSAYTLLNAEQERVMRAEVGRAHEAIELAGQMPQFSTGRYAVKWRPEFITTLIPHVQEARNIGHLLTIDGRLRAHDGDIGGALHDVKAILYGGRAIGDEPLLISQLVRMACDTAAVKLLERILTCGQASERALADLQKELEEQARTPYFMTGIRGERAGLDYMLQNGENGEIPAAVFRRILKETFAISFNATKPPRNEWLLEVDAWRVYLNIRAERAQFLHHINRIVELAKQPPWEAAYAIDSFIAEETKRKPPLSDLIGNCNKHYFAYTRCLAYLQTAYTAIAAERFRLAKGRWPKDLAELVPQYLDAVPLDPFDGKPLRYIRKGQAQVVYSVSQDREDQGGTFLNNPLDQGSDVGFILLDIPRRRQPGKPFAFPPRQAAGN
jgi:hypothetical protein